MAGLRWTPRGAVALPETLQVRIAPLFARRVQAGAPIPSRSLTITELERNLGWFANPGPRGRPVSSLVLSGVPLDTLAEVAAAVSAVRGSVRRIVVHADGQEVAAIVGSPLAKEVDLLAVAVRSVAEVEGIAGDLGARLDLVVPLEHDVLPHLEAITVAARRLGPVRITFTWPFPTARDGVGPPPPSEVVRSMPRDTLRDVPWTLKGLPPCLLVAGIPDVGDHVGRSSNRWYVDATHQLDRALLFLPDVVQFAKREGCRFCDLDPRCDGVAEQWLRTGLVPALVPIRGTGGPI